MAASGYIHKICFLCLDFFPVKPGNPNYENPFVSQWLFHFIKTEFPSCSQTTFLALAKALIRNTEEKKKEGEGCRDQDGIQTGRVISASSNSPQFCFYCEKRIHVLFNLYNDLPVFRKNYAEELSSLGTILKTKESTFMDEGSNKGKQSRLELLAEKYNVEGGPELFSAIRNELAQKSKLKAAVLKTRTPIHVHVPILVVIPSPSPPPLPPPTKLIQLWPVVMGTTSSSSASTITTSGRKVGDGRRIDESAAKSHIPNARQDPQSAEVAKKLDASSSSSPNSRGLFDYQN